MSRIALIGENSIAYINALLDIWNNGNCAVLIDWRIPLKTAVEMMKEANVSKCYIEKNILDRVELFVQNDIKFSTFERNNKTELLPEYIYNKYIPNYTHSEAVVIYSSGTTGKSKGIILSHYAINTNADAIIDYMKPTINDSIYIVKSLSHSSTLTGELLVALKSKTKVLIAPTIVPPRYVFNNLIKYSITILCVNPTLLSMYADERKRHEYKSPSLRVIYVSGSILNNKTYKVANEVFKDISIYNVYGLSEAGPRVTAQRASCCKGNSVGKPIMFVEIAIVSEKGEPLNRGERGIVCVNTPCRSDGYVLGEEKNKSLYKGWLNTGDIGYLDDNGELHIVGRKDDLIISDSHKIYPSEVENVILRNSKVLQCVVINAIKNEKTEIVCFYTSLNNEKLDLKIRKMLYKLLPSYEIPSVFINIDSFEYNSNGKINKQDLINKYRKV